LFIIPVAYSLIVHKIHMIPEEREALEIEAAGAGVMTSPQNRER
jgi:hypothetical protein